MPAGEPIRMMAADHAKIELAQGNGMVVMLFEDLAHGMLRTIYLRTRTSGQLEPNWLGDCRALGGRDVGRGHRRIQRSNLAERSRRAAQQCA